MTVLPVKFNTEIQGQSTANSFKVIAAPHPFEQRHIETFYPHGMTLQEVIEDLQPDPGLREFVAVFIGPHYIEPELYGKVRPNAGVEVYIRATTGVSAVVAVIAAVAAEAAVTYLALTGFMATVVGALISTAITMVGNMLFAPSAPKQDLTNLTGSSGGSPTESPTFSLTGARNAMRRFSVVPRVLGKHKFVPPYGAAPYTEVVGDDQYLRLLVVWGYGPLRITEIKIGDTDITSFEGVEVETVTGAAGDPALTLYPDVVRQEDLNTTLSTTYVERTTPIETDEIGVTLTFGQGLVKYSGNTRTDHSVTLTGEYKKTTDVSWTAFFSETVTDNTSQIKRVSYRVSGLDRAQYDVQIKRGDTPSVDTTVRDSVTWTALRSFTNEDPVGLSGLAKTAIRIKASDQLNGVVDELQGLCEAYIPAYDGVDWSNSDYSRNPADVFRYVLTGSENKRALAASSVDDTSLATWHDFCAAEGFTYDRVIDTKLSVQELLANIAQAGRAALNVIDGKWGVIIDTTRSTIIQHFTPRNSWNYSGQRMFADQPDALRVRFVNEDRDYRQDEMTVYDDGYSVSNATTFESLEVAGVVVPDNVYRYGRYVMALARLRPEFHTFDVDMEYLIATRGDRVAFNHDVPIIGLGNGRVKSVSSQQITLDEEITMESGGSYNIRFRLDDGTTLLRNVVLSVGSTKVIDLSPGDADQSVPAAGDLFQFGAVGSEMLDLIVHSIKPKNELQATLVCQPYSPEIFNADAVIPPFTSVVSDIVTRTINSPLDPVITNVVSDEEALSTTADGSVQLGIIMYFHAGVNTTATNGMILPTASYRARYRRLGTVTGPWIYVTDIPFDAREVLLAPVLQGEGYDVALQALSETGSTSNWVTVSNHTVVGTLGRPDDITTFSLNTIGDHTYVEWTYSPALDVVGYELRYHPDQNNTSWASMTAIALEIPTTTRSFTVPSRKGSYGIKAKDFGGLYSENALFVNASLEDPEALNVIQTETEHPTFGGTKVNTVVIGSSLQLDSASVMADWTTLAAVPLLSYGTGQGFETSGTYVFTSGDIDLSEVYTSRVTMDLDLSVISLLNLMSTWTTLSSVATLAGEGTEDAPRVTAEIATSIVDSVTPSYGSWQPFIVGDYTARHIKFRLSLTTTNVGVSPAVDSAVAHIDMPDRVTKGDDIVSGAATKSVTFSPAFQSVTTVNVTGQDMQTGDYIEVTNKTRTGFDVTFRNSGGTAVSRTFDYQAIGYGRERGT